VIDRGRILTESTVEQLRGASELEVSATPSDTALACLEAMPFVEEVRRHEGVLRARTDARHTAEINAELVRAGVAVTGLRRTERQLEDVFFEMTDHETQEASHV
jgi:ABC-type multidrug transport system ATPase subunit